MRYPSIKPLVWLMLLLYIMPEHYQMLKFENTILMQCRVCFGNVLTINILLCNIYGL